jgi:molybdenum cofactor guanylyltransferase
MPIARRVGRVPTHREEQPRLTGLVLAGGQSRRMGRDKTRIEVAGVPLVRRVADRLGEVCERVLVASGDGSSFIDIGLEEVADPVGFSGPLAGIVAGLEAAETELGAVVGADMPEVSPAVHVRLAQAWRGEAAVVPLVGERIQPLHGVYATRWAGRLRERLDHGRRGVIAALSDVGARGVGPEGWADLDADGRFARDLDVPDDLAPYEART